MCLPSSDTIISQLKDLITKYKAKSVYLARDDKKYDSLITAELDKISVGTVLLCVIYSEQHFRYIQLLAMVFLGNNFMLIFPGYYIKITQ